MPKPIKTYKPLDDEVFLNFADDSDKKESIVTDLADIDSDLSIVDSDGMSNDDGDQFSGPVTIRSNPPASRVWSDGVVLKYKGGDLVLVKGSNSVVKIIGPGRATDTYCVKYSGSANYIDTPLNNVKKAPKTAIWKDYWETVVDPYTEWKNKQKKTEKVPLKNNKK